MLRVLRSYATSLAVTPGDRDDLRSGYSKPIVLQGYRGEPFTGCAYDDSGDLFAIAESFSSNDFWYITGYYLPAGSSSFVGKNLELTTTHYDVVEGVTWDGKYWVVGPLYNELFLYTIKSYIRSKGTIQLKPPQNGGFTGQISIYRKNPAKRGTQLVAGIASSYADFFKYPAGGSPFAEISKDLDDPYGTAISIAP